MLIFGRYFVVLFCQIIERFYIIVSCLTFSNYKYLINNNLQQKLYQFFVKF